MTRTILIVLLLGTVAWSLLEVGVVQGKAWLGQQLLERAWSRAMESGEVVEPWPGAVSHPVARLRMPRLELDHLVLNGADTPILAWGPGMEIGPHGQRLIAAHRDTHFRSLRSLEPGDRAHLQHADGRIEHWTVTRIDVVDARSTSIDMAHGAEQLLLVTCYPFDASAPGGPLRLVASLHPASTKSAEESI
jgi:sortase A